MEFTDVVKTFKPRIGRRELFTLFLLALEIAVFSLIADHFLSSRNIMAILRNSVDLAIVSIGMTIVMIICGIDLSVGSALGVVGILVGWMLNAGTNPALIAIVAITAGCAIGLVNGFLVSVLRIPDIIATIGTQSILRAMVFFMLGGQWLTGLPPVFAFLTRGRVMGIPTPFIVISLFMIQLSGFTFNNSTLLALGLSVRQHRRCSVVGFHRDSCILKQVSVLIFPGPVTRSKQDATNMPSQRIGSPG